MSADPKLKRRLSHVPISVMVAWGESDRILDLEYGRAYTQAFPHAHFELIPESGHMSPIEQPERLVLLIRRFAISTRVASDV
jgi:pimeloyl-ACP methyl ester carboxylesterase